MKKIILFNMLVIALCFSSSYSMKKLLRRTRGTKRFFRKKWVVRGNGKHYNGGLEKNYGNSPLHKAVLEGDIKGIKKNDCYILKINKIGQTAIHVALFGNYCYKRREKIVSVLLKLFKDYLIEKYNNNPSKYEKIKDAFLNAKMSFFKVGSKDTRDTALNIAISKGYLSIAHKLIDLGVDVTMVCDDGCQWSALHFSLLLNLKRNKAIVTKEVQCLACKILEKIKHKKKLLKVINALVVVKSGKGEGKYNALKLAKSKGYFFVVKKITKSYFDSF
ncbi:hypothetical protein ACFLYU_00835 [Candidatus Dependentiae bacterium]